jgi:SsrA-binding protein
MPSLADNRKALYDYSLGEELEVGIVLSGQETKSTKMGGMRLRGAYAVVRDGALWLIGAYITRYKPAGPLEDYDPQRTRKLLAHRREVQKIVGRLAGERLTLIPIKAYTRSGKIKIALSLARAKRAFEKRDAIRERDVSREIARTVGRRTRST